MEEALLAALKADAALAAAATGGMSWGLRQPGKGLPCVVLHRITSGRDYDMDGPTSLTGPVVQADFLAGSYAAAKGLARLFEAAIAGLAAPFQGAFIEDERDDAEGADAPQSDRAEQVFRTSLDVRVWFDPAA